MIEMLRTGDAKKEKKAVRLARLRIGQHKRAGKIRDNLLAIIASQRREAQERREKTRGTIPGIKEKERRGE